MELTIEIIEAGAHAAQAEAGTETQGVLRVANDADPLELPLDGVQRIELDFPKFTDGRAYSQAVLLRRRRGFAGEIRATGDVLIDQLVQMQRAGFSSAVLKDGKDPVDAQRQFAQYPGYYQGDAMKPRPLFKDTV